MNCSLQNSQSGWHEITLKYLSITEEEYSQITLQIKTGILMNSSVTFVRMEYHGEEYFGKSGVDSTPTNASSALSVSSFLRLTIAATTLTLPNLCSVPMSVLMTAAGLRPFASAWRKTLAGADRRPTFWRTWTRAPSTTSSCRSTKTCWPSPSTSTRAMTRSPSWRKARGATARRWARARPTWTSSSVRNSDTCRWWSFCASSWVSGVDFPFGLVDVARSNAI